ncbi:MAG: hypothetical protein R3F19_25370 [Verrucomicrobiales bacterium]
MAWNRLILDAESAYGRSTKAFEAHEIQFPLHLDLDWKRYKDAAIVHCVGGNTLEKLQLMFGMYMQTFFHDPKGTMVTLLDMWGGGSLLVFSFSGMNAPSLHTAH